MKHLRRNRALATLLSLVMVAGLFPGTAFAAGDGTMVDTAISQSETSLLSSVSDVSYLDENGEEQTVSSATSVESTTIDWTAGWYVVKNSVTISDRITVTGDVHLILKDNCTLQAQNGIEVNSDGASLTIYAQSTDEDTMGALIAIGVEYGDSGIGGDKYKFQGTVIINGGNITATGTGESSAGIGGISQVGAESGPSTGSTWYDAGRDWAMQNGVSDGTNIEASITREQLATMLYRYAGEPAVSGTITGFTDAAAVSGWAQDAMLWAIENGLISGMGDGSLNPQGNATRAQVATILARFVKWAA